MNDEATSPGPGPVAGGVPPAIDVTLDAAGTALVVLDLDGTPQIANRRALHLLGADAPDEIRRGAPAQEILRSFLDHAPRDIASGSVTGTWHGDVDVTSVTGTPLVYGTTITVHHGTPADQDGFIGITAHDVTFLREEERRLRHRAGHDALTGLANRYQILTTLERMIARQRERVGHVAAIFVDLDQLKYVNDALGHQVGDRLLAGAAQRLANAVRPDDHVARIGGDEFLVVCADIPDDAAALGLAEQIRRALTGRLHLRHLDVPFSVSIGVALSRSEQAEMTDAAIAASLVSDADSAMYHAKTSGRGRCAVFTAAMRTATRERTALGVALSKAIDDRLLSFTYQPVFSALDRRIVGAEALVRWNTRHGVLHPSEFVPIAEESGTMGKLGQLVIEEVLLQARVWRERGVVDDRFAVHVNVSPLHLASSSFVNLVVGLLRRHGLSPHQLVLEMNEPALLGRNGDFDRSVRSLRRLGIKLAIDHFGTGTGSLSMLTDVGADILKLNASYGVSETADQADSRLLHAIVALAHALDMRVIAEQVSQADQLHRVRAAGCDLVQGDLLGVAAAPDEMATVSTY